MVPSFRNRLSNQKEKERELICFPIRTPAPPMQRLLLMQMLEEAVLADSDYMVTVPSPVQLPKVA